MTRDSRYPPYGRDPLGARFMGSGGADRQSPHLSIVESQPIDITALIRREIQQRDWERVMIQGDKRAPVFLPDRIRRLWR
jgi:hypothetical protein